MRCAATLESLIDAGIDIGSLKGADTALVVGTSKGPIEQWLSPHVNSGAGDSAGSELGHCGVTVGRADRIKTAPSHPAPAGLADLAGQISRDIGMVGPRLTVSAACASGLHALIRAVLLIGSGDAQRVLVVAAESSLHALFVGNFQRLGVLPPPGFGCHPFDRDRRGFVMSEAVAAVVLESPDLPKRRAPARPPVAVERFAIAGDATHLTGNDPQARSLRRILADVIDGRQIDLVHAHGTGTKVNDALELSALEATVATSKPCPALYSHKGAIGHSLGASGLVSVVLNCMSHQTGIIPGNVQTLQPMESSSVEIRTQPTHRKVERSIAIAAGFGGAMAAVGLRSLLNSA